MTSSLAVAQKIEARAKRSPPTTTLVCLNFKVPLSVRQQFKICAARRNTTMTDLLLRLLDEEIKK
jgi:hypothetical protein